MNTSSWIVFKNLIKRSGSEIESSVSRYLPHEELEKLEGITPSTKDPFTSSLSMKERLDRVHYSWMISFLEPFAENDRRIIVSALSEEQSEKLKEHFKITEAPYLLKDSAKNYLLKAIYEWLISDQKDFLPIEFLPDYPLNPLLELSKKELQSLADYLGLHDLALELKHVIKAEKIKKIQEVLSKEELEYTKSRVKIKEPLTFSRLNLEKWNGDPEQLKGILHHRGFNRLAKALFGCHPSLLWHISHRLDTGRTKILRKFFADINNEDVQKVLIEQILNLIPKLHKGS